MQPILVIVAVLMLSLGVIGFVILDALRAGRLAKVVRCPDDGHPAAVRREPWRAVLSLFLPKRERVIECSRWPDKAGCARACERRIRP